MVRSAPYHPAREPGAMPYLILFLLIFFLALLASCMVG